MELKFPTKDQLKNEMLKDILNKYSIKEIKLHPIAIILNYDKYLIEQFCELLEYGYKYTRLRYLIFKKIQGGLK